MVNEHLKQNDVNNQTVMDYRRKCVLSVKYVERKQMVVDVWKKVLPKLKFQNFVDKMEMEI